MTYRDPQTSGAVPVTRVDVLDTQALFLVTALRLHNRKSAQDMDALWEGLALNVGVEKGQEARSNFEGLMSFFSRHGRRPLLTHDGSCSCVGADEAVFAQFVQLAALGAPEDAMLMGMLMLRADIVPLAVGLAQQLGLLTRVTFSHRGVSFEASGSHAYH